MITEEKIEKKAEKYASSFEWTNDDRIIDYSKQGFIAGAKLMQKELYAETEKFKADCLELCKLKDMRIEQLEKQIEEMKNCTNCDNEEGNYCHSASPCKNKDQWKLKE